MQKTKDERVQKFLEEIGMFDEEKLNILLKLREIVFEEFPDVQEKMMYGGIMFSIDADFGGIFVSKKHISFEFSKGYRFSDPEELLEGTGKFRRHLKIRSLSDVEAKNVIFFVKQAGII